MTLPPFTEERAKLDFALNIYKSETAHLRDVLDGFLLTESEGKKCSKRSPLNEDVSSMEQTTAPPPPQNSSESH